MIQGNPMMNKAMDEIDALLNSAKNDTRSLYTMDLTPWLELEIHLSTALMWCKLGRQVAEGQLQR